MNLTEIAFKNNRVTLLCLLVVLVLGITQYGNLSRDSMPPFTVRVATIITNFPGASPERVESLISEKIEKVIQEIPEVSLVSSTSRTGVSIVKVGLDDNVTEAELQSIWDLARRKIEGIKNDLPDGIYGPNLKDDELGVVYGIFVGLKSDGNYEYKEIKKYADKLRNELISLDDASRVEIGGTVEERIYVEYNEATLAKLGLSANKLKNIISSSNIIIPSGEVNMGEERIIVESSGNFESEEAIRNLLIPIGMKGDVVPLGDISTVRRGYEYPKESIVRIDSKPGISLFISTKENANILQLGEAVDQVIANYNQHLPLGIEAIRVMAQDKFVHFKIDDFVMNLVQSIVIVLLVILFILGWRAGVVIASLIPTTMVLTFWLMGILEVGLNQVTLASLIMALGLLVDNGIVMVESLLEKMQAGQSKLQAAANSAKEFMIPLLISTLTTCAAFLPFYLAVGTMGEIMGNIFIVISIALLSSWVLAFTIIPMFGTYLLKIKQHEASHKTIFDQFRVGYNHFLKWSLNRPLFVTMSIIMLFAMALIGFRFIPSIFMPPSDRPLIVIDMNLPLGTQIEVTDEYIGKIEHYIEDSLLVNDARKEGVLNWSAYIGKGPKSYDLGYQQGEPNAAYAHVLVNTTSDIANTEIIRQLQTFVKQAVPDGNVKIDRLVGAGGASAPIEVRISGDDPDALFNIVDKVRIQMLQIPGTKNVMDDWGPKIKKLYINIDENKLAKSSLTNQDVALSLLTSLSGYDIGDYREGDLNIPIIMKQEHSEDLNYADIEGITIFSQSTGKNVALAQVADISIDWQYSKILRRDLKRTVIISASVEEGYLASEIMKSIEPMMQAESANWPSGYRYQFGGDAEGNNDAMGAVVQNLPYAFFIIILLLVIQFNSIRKAGIILLTIPLGIIGVTGGLLGAFSVFSFTAFLGIISLAGIIINDAIVLVDKIGSELDAGKPLIESITKSANDRFSPILLTTLTTSCGMIPLWTGGGILWQPMAISMIFGLMFATLILLIFVPVIYKLLYTEKPTN